MRRAHTNEAINKHDDEVGVDEVFSNCWYYWWYYRWYFWWNNRWYSSARSIPNKCPLPGPSHYHNLDPSLPSTSSVFILPSGFLPNNHNVNMKIEKYCQRPENILRFGSVAWNGTTAEGSVCLRLCASLRLLAMLLFVICATKTQTDTSSKEDVNAKLCKLCSMVR